MIRLAALLLLCASSVLAAPLSRGQPALTWLAGAELPAGPDDTLQLLQFWASWCHSCAGVTTDLAALVRQRPGVRHLAVSTDAKLVDAQAAAARMNGYAGGAAVIAHDGGEFAARYQVVTVPTVLLLAPDGRELGRFSGHLNATDLMALDALLVGADHRDAGQ